MKVRRRGTFEAKQYFKIGDHPNEHVHAVAIPILEEVEGKRWPDSGRLAKLEECDPADIRYSVFSTPEKEQDKYFVLWPGWWILELDGEVVGVRSPENFAKEFERDKLNPPSTETQSTKGSK